jgi:hypothetical protein
VSTVKVHKADIHDIDVIHRQLTVKRVALGINCIMMAFVQKRNLRLLKL